MRIRGIRAWEILDSRGNPTVAAECELEGGTRARAHAPSGASTGKHEAVELRDGDMSRYAGKGVRRAVSNVNDRIAPALIGLSADQLRVVDERMLSLDGTPDKSSLGANAILAVSCAVARAAACVSGIPLWRWLGADRTPRLPVPMVNILSGGLHAGRNIEFQDFLVQPHGIVGYGNQVEAVVRVHRCTKELLTAEGYELSGVADEGGWGAKMASNERAIELLTRAIERAGLRPGADMSICLDVAASHFYVGNGVYHLGTEGRNLSSEDMISLLSDWCRKYPIVSIEDGLEEDDWDGWARFTRMLGGNIQLIGDDFFTTNPERVAKGIQAGAANAVLVKMNQIGTLTETLGVVDQARDAGWRSVVSARSGETEDDFLSDLAVASGAGQIKIGSITRSERLAKYNRLFEIEREMEC